MTDINLIAVIGNVPVPTKGTLKEWIKSDPERVRFIPAIVNSPLHDAFRTDAAHIPTDHIAVVHGKRWTATIVRKSDKLTVK